MPLNQRGLAHFVLILLLLAGIGIGIYLVQRPAIFRPKASESTPQKITNENFEPKTNPYGDAWAWKKAPNPGIPISLGAAGIMQYISRTNTGAYTYQDADGTIKEALAQYIAKTNSGYVYLDSYEPIHEGVEPRSIALITRVKQINPNIKFLGYFVQWEVLPWWSDIVGKADAGDQNFENFFVHREGTSPTKANRITNQPDHPERGVVPVLDITNPNMRAYLIPKLIASIQAAKMDGVMNDSLFLNAANTFNPTSLSPDNIMPAATKAAWPAAMAQFVQEIRTAMNGKNMEIFGNVDDDFPQFMQNDLLRAGRLDGVIFEDPF